MELVLIHQLTGDVLVVDAGEITPPQLGEFINLGYDIYEYRNKWELAKYVREL